MELNIRLAGAAGQGLATTSDLLGLALTRAGYFAQARNDAESRIRGGLNFNHLRAADEPRPGVTDRVDILIAQTEAAATEFAPLLAEGGVIIAQDDWSLKGAAPFFLAPLAQEAGNAKAAGTVAFGALARLMGLDRELTEKVVTGKFGDSGKLAEVNRRALETGRQAAEAWDRSDEFRLPPTQPADRLWLSGAQAIALGAVAAGVTFVAGYPMSPATGILAGLASFSDQAGVLLEQAEDEVAAINMVAGAAYAGARSMTATSGGGLCLMTEGVSLLGMIEAPAVIALAQRPGPATGLPTRLAQGDLNLVRFAGHGYFTRIILAPRNIGDCFEVAAAAFDLAERFQTPVFILTDQLLQDSFGSLDRPVIEGLPEARHYMTADQLNALDAYRRYQPMEDGVSPLAAPGASEQVVVVDSDEHDYDGHLTERADLAQEMAQRRLDKTAAAMEAAWPPEIEGDARAETLAVCWGSTYETAAEAVARLRAEGRAIGLVNLSWLWPLPEEELTELVGQAEKLIVIEASVGGELAGVLREVTLRRPEVVVTKLDGRPFTVDGLYARLSEEM